VIVAVRPWRVQDGEAVGIACWLWCPGCEELHRIVVDPGPSGIGWSWNGDTVRPTFTPSYLVPWHELIGGGIYVERRCHAYITDGQWQYLGDSTHALAGQTVPCEPLPYEP